MTIRHYILGADGNPQEADFLEFVTWLKDHGENTRIKKTIFGKTEVSTIFLGVAGPRLTPGPPLLFETMIFGGPLDCRRTRRYATRTEALAGHDEAVREVTVAEQRN